MPFHFVLDVDLGTKEKNGQGFLKKIARKLTAVKTIVYAEKDE